MSVTTETVTTRRPATLTAAVAVTVVTAIAAVVNGIMIATGGLDLIKDVFADAGLPGLTDEDIEGLALLAGHASLDDFVSTFQTRGYLALVTGAALLVFGLVMVKAATWARIMVTIAAALSIVFALVILADETTSTMALLAVVTMIASVVAIVLTWLPANGRYAKALRN